jgi:low temperature requirement protein LtrA
MRHVGDEERADRVSAARRLWNPPRQFADRPTDRRVTFLELFFDLVFVVVIAQLADRLAVHPTWPGVGWFVFLFYAVWASWINGTLYYDLHGTNDVSVRVFTFLQMLAVAVMAVFVADVPGDGAAGFALGYAANTLVLVVLWFRTGVHDPQHRAASVPYSAAYLVAAVLFAASAAVDAPLIYWLWGLAMLVEVTGQIHAYGVWTPPTDQGGAVFAATPSLIERLGLFVIIVLGEVIVGAVNGMAALDPVTADGVVIGVLGVLVAIGLWWIYFDLVSNHAPAPRRTQLWLYLHLPLVIAMGAVGAGLLNAVQGSTHPLPANVRRLLVGALGVAVGSVAALTGTLEIRRSYPALYRTATATLVGSAVVITGVGLTDWGAKGTLAVMVALLGLPIATGIAGWLKRTGGADISLHP